MPARQLQKVIGLEDHIVEFQEGERLFAVQPELHAVERQHAVDREMRPDIAQQFDIAELAQPFVIVDHHGIGRPVAERQELLEYGPDRGDVGVDLIVRQHLPAFVLARRIADLGGAAAHDHDRLVPRLLELAQHHDRDQMADMQRGPGGVEADITRHDILARKAVEPVGVGQLVDIAALVERAKEIG